MTGAQPADVSSACLCFQSPAEPCLRIVNTPTVRRLPDGSPAQPDEALRASRRRILAQGSCRLLALGALLGSPFPAPAAAGTDRADVTASGELPDTQRRAFSARLQTISAREGSDYRLLRVPAPLESTDRIDVLGFFWFGCPHCHTLEPALKAWASRLPADAAFRKVHVPWRDQLQQLYYTLEALGKTALTDKVFAAIHLEKANLQSVQQMAEWIGRQGVSEKVFMEAFESFGVRTRMRRAAQLAEAYRLEGVPAIGIGGRFLTAPSMAGSNTQALEVADQLIEMERRARRTPKT